MAEEGATVALDDESCEPKKIGFYSSKKTFNASTKVFFPMPSTLSV